MRWLVSSVARVINPTAADGSTAFERSDVVKNFFMSHEEATAHAIHLASKSPGVGYAVYKIDVVYETGTPIVLEKIVNPRGELVMRPEERA